MAPLQALCTLLVIMSTQVFTEAVTYEDCGSSLAQIQSLEISNCTTLPCQIVCGETMNLSVTFTPNTQIKNASVSVHGILGGIPIPFAISPTNACENSGLSCPLSSGQAVTYHYSLHISESYPHVSVIIKWEIKQAQDEIICFEFSAQLV